MTDIILFFSSMVAVPSWRTPVLIPKIEYGRVFGRRGLTDVRHAVIISQSIMDNPPLTTTGILHPFCAIILVAIASAAAIPSLSMASVLYRLQLAEPQSSSTGCHLRDDERDYYYSPHTA